MMLRELLEANLRGAGPRVLAVALLSCVASVTRGEELSGAEAAQASVNVAVADPPLSDSGFWIVSTHDSPQSFDHARPRFCPAVLRYEQCVGYRPSRIAELCAGLEPGIPVCIMVHGSFVDWASACRESISTWHWLRRGSMGRRMQMIYLTWPSYSPLGPMLQLEVNKLGRRAARNGYYLAELTQHVPPECPICLLGHSHGTRVIASALHLLAGGSVQGVCHPYARAAGRHIRTVFAASAIDHDWLNPSHRYGRALCSTQCLLNLQNRRDPALRIYSCRLPLIAKQPFGLTGLTFRDRRQLGAWGQKVNDYDVTEVIGAAHLWPYYFNRISLACAVHNYVYFPERIPPSAASSN
ncbi:MAG: alpha/beta hydrolase [Fuerstiella sp.]|nr:alpha/beta hydrolase [Fuerstiella sp.]